jgi:dihydropteroate synthase
MPGCTPRCCDRSDGVEGDIVIVRRLTATDAAARAQRIASVLPPATAAAVAAAAGVEVLIDDAPGSSVDAVIAVLTDAGATAVRGDDGRLVAAVTRPQLLAAQRAAEDEEGAGVRRLLEAYERCTAPDGAFRLRERTLDLRDEAQVMGIVNVTPDSFYDRAAGLDDVLARTRAIAAAGGALVDIGGQSYAHWNPRIAADEERERVVPAVAAIRAAGIDIAISIDTFKASVADAALAAGAHLINDCSGLSDPALAGVVARYDAALVVMHLKGELNVRDPGGYSYVDAMAEIVEFLYEKTEAALAAGVKREAIAIDPGLEFGKEPETDLEILDRFGELRALGYPILFASSRKSFIGRIFDRPAKELLIPSLATAGLGIAAGARMLRVHDVVETVQLARMYAAVLPGERARLPVAAAMPGTPGNSAAPTAV